MEHLRWPVVWQAALSDDHEVVVRRRPDGSGYLALHDPPLVDHDGKPRRLVRVGYDVDLGDGGRPTDDLVDGWRQACEAVIQRHRMMAQQRTPFGPHH